MGDAGTARVFISYSTLDRQLADQLKEALTRAGADVWVDHERLTAGTPDWDATIRQNIKRSTAVIYIASPSAVQSPYVKDELHIARDNQIRVLPFWIAGEKRSDVMPLGFGMTQGFDARGASYGAGQAQLLAALGLSAASARPPVPAANSPAAGPYDWRRLGSYQLQRKLGESGRAQVYLARDVRLGRDVVVKVLDRKLAERAGLQERFMREARRAAALDHPNIVPLYDFGDQGALYLVMPFITGGSLKDSLPRTPLLVSDVVAYASQISDALTYAHDRQVIHGDVKPSNILIHADGRLMLSDFGVANIIGQADMLNALTNSLDASTLQYMAPEQVRGNSVAFSDTYSLAVVLFQLLTGHLPFTGSSSQEVMQKILFDPPAPLRIYNPEIPPRMEEAVLWALAKYPEDRPQRASDLGTALLQSSRPPSI